MLDGRGKVIAVLPGHLYHALDFSGDGKEEFVCVVRGKDGRPYLTAYGTGTWLLVNEDKKWETTCCAVLGATLR